MYNNTNIESADTELKLVAGQVNNVPSQSRKMYAMSRGAAPMAEMSMDAVAPSFQQEAFSDYHMYMLPRKVNVEPFSSKKIKLYDDRNSVKITRKYEYSANRGGNDVVSKISILNEDSSNMGVPLPSGKITVFEKDSTGNFEKSGEAQISHTPIGKEFDFEIGKAFDIKAKRTQIDNKRDNNRRTGSYKIKIELDNSKKEAVIVNVKEQVYNQNWKISQSSHIYKKLSANQIEFPVEIAAGKKVSLNFQVDYSW